MHGTIWAVGLRQRTHSALPARLPLRLNRRPASTGSKPRNPYAGKQAYSEFTADPLFGEIPRPPPQDFPPISQRLKPLIPFFIYCTALTSVATHLLRKRKLKEEEEHRVAARVSILVGLVSRLRAGDALTDAEIDRELEMVGLKERPALQSMAAGAEGADVESLQEAGNVSWKEMLLGRKRSKLGEKEQEEKAEQEWAESECPPATIVLE